MDAKRVLPEGVVSILHSRQTVEIESRGRDRKLVQPFVTAFLTPFSRCDPMGYIELSSECIRPDK